MSPQEFLRRLSLLAASILTTVSWMSIYGDSCAPPMAEATGLTTASTMLLVPVAQGGTIDGTAISAAANAWNWQCGPVGNPQLTTSGSGDLRAYVHFHDGTASENGFPTTGVSKCGYTQTYFSQAGEITGADVHLFTKQEGGGSCTGYQTAILMHELGHAMGVGDSSCSGRVMGDPFSPLVDADCDAIDQNFWTDADRLDPDDPNPDGPCAI